jgi:hypothetical protein
VGVGRGAFGFFLGLALLLELAEFAHGSAHHALEAGFDGEQALVGGGFASLVVGGGGVDEGSGDDQAGGELRGLVIEVEVVLLLLFFGPGVGFVFGFVVALVVFFEEGFEAEALAVVEVVVGFLDAFEPPGGGEDSVGVVELEWVLGVESGEEGVSEGVEGLFAFGGEEEVGAEGVVGGGVLGGLGLALWGSGACGFPGVLAVGGEFACGDGGVAVAAGRRGHGPLLCIGGTVLKRLGTCPPGAVWSLALVVVRLGEYRTFA